MRLKDNSVNAIVFFVIKELMSGSSEGQSLLLLLGVKKNGMKPESMLLIPELK